jgi:anionic cell wall polymer biosynthesis LytR-Cps2A-Psr (LCP) family protein
LWAKLCIILGAVVMVISGLSVVVPKIATAWFAGNIDQVDAIPEELRGTNIDGPINFLLLGMDDREGEGVGGVRADSIILVHIPAGHDRVFMISMPRDARVEIPPFPQTNYVGGTSKINSAFSFGAKTAGPGPSMWDRDFDLSPEGRSRGAALTMLTISNLVPGGLKFHGAGIIDFKGFEAVVNALGGVHMCIDTDLYSIHYYPDGTKSGNPLHEDYGNRYGTGKHYEIGCRDMQPWEALDYSRQRYELPNGDYDRQRHQQQLLKAIVKKIASTDTLTNFSTIRRLQQAAGDLLTLDTGGNKLEDWVLTLSSLRSDDMILIRTNGGQYSGYGDGTSDEQLLPDTLELLKSVQTDTVFEFLTTHQDWVAAG